MNRWLKDQVINLKILKGHSGVHTLKNMQWKKNYVHVLVTCTVKDQINMLRGKYSNPEMAIDWVLTVGADYNC